jgi:hypothetical protein
MSALKTNGLTTKAPPVSESTFSYGAQERSYQGAGWIVFAAIMFVLAGCLSIIWASRPFRARTSSWPTQHTSSVV